MKIILDTNVIVSGVFFSGPPFQILQAWRDEKGRLVARCEWGQVPSQEKRA